MVKEKILNKSPLEIQKLSLKKTSIREWKYTVSQVLFIGSNNKY